MEMHVIKNHLRTCHLNVKPETTCCRKQENQDNDKFPIGSLHYSENKKKS